MNLNSLPKTNSRQKKRVGRGLSSGKGKTSARGQKGQKARGKVPVWMMGGGLPLYKKLPLRRGWGNRKVTNKPLAVSLDLLNSFKGEVTLATLLEKGIFNKRELAARGVKVVNVGELKSPVTIKLPVTKKAAEKIIQAGGKVE